MPRRALPGLLVVIVVSLSSRAAFAEGRARLVAHSLYSFERLDVRAGKLRRQAMTMGMERVKATPEVMLAKLFGPGTLELPAKAGEVRWIPTRGKPRLLGRVTEMAGEEVFVPTRATQRFRNQILGRRIVNALEGYRGGRGPYGTWLDPKRSQLIGGEATYYRPMTQWPHGGSDPSSVGVQDTAAYATHDEDLYHALQSREGVSEGGLAVRYSEPGRDGGRTRVRAVFYPRGESASRQSMFDRVAGLIFGLGQSGGGALVEREKVAAGQNPIRAQTRKAMHALRGFVIDQQKRWASLEQVKSPKVQLETVVAEQLWQIGSRDYFSKEPTPRVQKGVPPNLMLSVLYGPGKVKIGDDRAVTYHPLNGDAVVLGTMTPAGRKFKPAPEVEARRNQHIGRTILDHIMSRETRRKGWGWDRNHTFARFPQRVVSQSKEAIAVPGRYGATSVPSAQTVLIAEADGHVVDTAGYLFPKAIEGVILPPDKEKTITVAWRSSELTLQGEQGGFQARVPAGLVVEHELTLMNKTYDGHRIQYAYRVVPETK